MEELFEKRIPNKTIDKEILLCYNDKVNKKEKISTEVVMLRKIIALLLVLCMVSSVLISCAKEPPTDESEPAESNGVAIANTEEYLYTVVVSNKIDKKDRLIIRDKISELGANHGIKLGFKVQSKGDKIEDVANEILVGETQRPESIEAVKNLKPGEYTLSYNSDSHRLVIAGSCTWLSIEAFDYFIENYFDDQSKQIVIPEDLSYSCRTDLPLMSVAIDGVDITDYVIVVPSTDDIYAYYTALNIADYFTANMGFDIKIVDDEEEATEYEILVGETNRTESEDEIEFHAGEYLLAKKNNKIIMRGNGVYLAAGAGKLVHEHLSGEGMNREVNIMSLTDTQLAESYSALANKATNVILMIGDGMGFNHVSAALDNGLDAFAANSFISKGSAVTRSQSVINGQAGYTDSAASATALATGYKTINGYVGKDANGNNLKNVRELADEYGASTAVITTDVITGATPSGFLAHNISRNSTAALLTDINRLIANEKIEYCEGDVGNDLTVHTRAALKTIAYTNAPFFMMVEEGQIDKRSHENNFTSMVDMVARYNDAIIYAATFALVNPDTVLIVTADHETGGLVADSEANGGFNFTSTDHTNADVPVYALGAGAEIFNDVATENTDIAKFIAKHFGANTFGGTVDMRRAA